MPLIVVRVTAEAATVDEFVARFARYFRDGDMLFVPTEGVQPTGRRVRFVFALKGGEEVIVGEGVVMRMRRDSGDPRRPPGMELRYEIVDEASQAIVERLLAARLTPPPYLSMRIDGVADSQQVTLPHPQIEPPSLPPLPTARRAPAIPPPLPLPLPPPPVPPPSPIPLTASMVKRPSARSRWRRCRRCRCRRRRGGARLAPARRRAGDGRGAVGDDAGDGDDFPRGAVARDGAALRPSTTATSPSATTTSPSATAPRGASAAPIAVGGNGLVSPASASPPVAAGPRPASTGGARPPPAPPRARPGSRRRRAARDHVADRLDSSSSTARSAAPSPLTVAGRAGRARHRRRAAALDLGARARRRRRPRAARPRAADGARCAS